MQLDWLVNLVNKSMCLEVCKDIKKQFNNREINDLINYIKGFLDKEDMHVEISYGNRHIGRTFTIQSDINPTSITLDVDTYVDTIVELFISVYLEEGEWREDKIQHTINYKISFNMKENKLDINKDEHKITKEPNSRIIKHKIINNFRTYFDNKLRYELNDESFWDLMDSRFNSHKTTETYIDLGDQAVRREMIFNVGFANSIDIKYWEADRYYADPFDDLYNISYSSENKMKESTEEVFNDFINGGNNLSLYKQKY